MPELPDLLYIQSYLRSTIIGRTIHALEIRQPVVLRVNLILAGRLQHQQPSQTPEAYLCLSLLFDDATRLNLCDEQKMAKAYLIRHDEIGSVPKYPTQGISILSPEFTLDSFRELIAPHRRKQVRVFLNDQTILSAIGNAYADEILFEARIHPKTFVSRLSVVEIDRLHAAIVTVMQWGIQQVERAAEPIHVKVRSHMRVRNRHGSPCPNCGTTIRREGVRGYDVFFCPSCQPASRKLFLDWGKIPGAGGSEEGQDHR